MKGDLVILMLDRLKVSNVFYTNELTINELINDYAEFVAIKLFQENRGLDEQEQK